MIQELVYTSAQRGLQAGSSGFCTVGSTRGMPVNLAKLLENLSGYRHIEAAGPTPSSGNPVNFSYVRARVGGKLYYVMSRVSDAGLDYSGRSNKLAHHVVLDDAQLDGGGPAWLLRQAGFVMEEWSGDPRHLQGRVLPRGNLSPIVCRTWKFVTGDAGWAGALLESYSLKKPISVVYPIGADVLQLVLEAQSLLPANARWEATFSTYFTKLPPGVDCLWRFMPAGSIEIGLARRARDQMFLDLVAPHVEVNDEFAAMAREGRSLTSRRLPSTVHSAPETDVDELGLINALELMEEPPPLSPPSLALQPRHSYAEQSELTRPPRLGSYSRELLPSSRWPIIAICLALLLLIAGVSLWLVNQNFKTPRIAQNLPDRFRDNPSQSVPVNSSQERHEPLDTILDDTVPKSGGEPIVEPEPIESSSGNTSPVSPPPTSKQGIAEESAHSEAEGKTLPPLVDHEVFVPAIIDGLLDGNLDVSINLPGTGSDNQKWRPELCLPPHIKSLVSFEPSIEGDANQFIVTFHESMRFPKICLGMMKIDSGIDGSQRPVVRLRVSNSFESSARAFFDAEHRNFCRDVLSQCTLDLQSEQNVVHISLVPECKLVQYESGKNDWEFDTYLPLDRLRVRTKSRAKYLSGISERLRSLEVVPDRPKVLHCFIDANTQDAWFQERFWDSLKYELLLEPLPKMTGSQSRYLVTLRLIRPNRPRSARPRLDTRPNPFNTNTIVELQNRLAFENAADRFREFRKRLFELTKDLGAMDFRDVGERTKALSEVRQNPDLANAIPILLKMQDVAWLGKELDHFEAVDWTQLQRELQFPFDSLEVVFESESAGITSQQVIEVQNKKDPIRAADQPNGAGLDDATSSVRN